MVEVALVQHRLRNVLRPTLHVRAVAVERAQHPARFRLHVVREFALHVVPRHRFVNHQQLQVVKVVFPQLRFDAVLRPIGRNRRDPEKRSELRLENRRGIEAAHRINSALEFRRRDHLKITVFGQCEKVLCAHESARFVEIFPRVVNVARRGGMLLRDVIEHFANDLVFAIDALQIAVVAMAGKCRCVRAATRIRAFARVPLSDAFGHLSKPRPECGRSRGSA